MIIFHKVHIENFGSILGPMEYTWDSPGINLIIAPNGSGKTTLISSLCWALYGVLLKKGGTVEPWPEFRLAQGKNYRGTKVELTFQKDGVDYLIIRCLNYKGKIEGYPGGSRVFLYENHKLKESLRDKRDVNKAIQDILGFSYPLFINTVLFGQKLKRLVQEDGSKRKSIMDEAFEITYIQDAKAAAEEKRNKLKSELGVIQYQIGKDRVAIQETRDLYNLQTENAKLFKQKKRDNLKLWKGKITQAKKDIEDLKSQVVRISSNLDMESLKRELEQCRRVIADREDLTAIPLSLIENSEKEIVRLSTELRKIEKAIADPETFKCTYCQAPLKGDKYKEVKAKLNQKKEETLKYIDHHKKVNAKGKQNLQEAKEKIAKAKEFVKSVGGKVESYQKSKEKNDRIKSRIKNLQFELRTAEDMLVLVRNDKLRTNRTELKAKLKSKQAELKALANQEAILQKELDLYLWAIGDPLSNSGLKAYIFDQMLALVNLELSKYKPILGFTIEFGIDLDSARKDFYVAITRNKTPVDYAELSGGQQQLVDIAIAFSIHSVVSEQKPCNILIMDEVFESLSENNIDLISDLIRVKASDKSVHVVTHQSRFTPTNANINYLTLHKKRGTIYG